MRIICSAWIFFGLVFVYFQEVKADEPATLSLAGQLGASIDGTNFYMNLGGPNLKVSYSDFMFGVSFYPSLRLAPGTVIPILGVGGFIDYKRFEIIMPLYVSGGVLTVSYGIAYRF